MRKSPLILLLSSIFFLSSCEKEERLSGCIDPQRIRSGPCTFDYTPVRGCNGRTYPIACSPDLAGLKSWTAGACK
ncbi:MAG: hypothetical protein B7Z16_01180 [Algoriphagus sp. 32-45-6]|nr:MAG: hypothetical protein B7Z16_01180 [Algoriphagus sp. 32-45-6]